MTKLTKKYIHEHRHSIHTYESFGRAVIEQLLNAAEQQAGDSGVEKASINVKYEIAAYEPMTCIQICGEYNGVRICYHVNV